jgi:UDP-N-acetylglucosamine 1-carboxyvinyltransferase
MEQIVINGGAPLHGRVEVSGAKNAALPILFATILTNDISVIENVPQISDVRLTLQILREMGASVKFIDASTVEIDTRNVVGGTSPYELVKRMRGSTYLMGAELGRFGCARVGWPGGCDFGVRPIDQHVKAFEALGAVFSNDNGFFTITAEDGVKGAHIYFDTVSVGATVNAILASVRADGLTIIESPAKEPHIVDLANFLNACGAAISGAGTDLIKVKGTPHLHGCTYAIIPDMIEAGTYMIAAAATNGEVEVANVIPKHLEAITAKLSEMQVEVIENDDSIIVKKASELINVNVKTMPYPGFPTDMHPQMAALMCLAKGMGRITEGVFDNRFKYVQEFLRMGASVNVVDNVAIIQGGTGFSPAPVSAVDLRAGAAMIIAGLVANGVTVISDIETIERGYDNIVEKLRSLGANIEKRSS